MSPGRRFGVAVTCIDGRIHDALRRWVLDRLDIDTVDLVTVQGPDAVLAGGDSDWIERLAKRVLVSHGAHGSSSVVLASHSDCAAHPVTDDQHLRDLGPAAIRLRSLLPSMEVVAVHVQQRGDGWEVVPLLPTQLPIEKEAVRE